MRMMGLALDVVVAEVGGEVHAEADAHDEVDEGDPVQHDAPQGHESQGSLFFKSILEEFCYLKHFPTWVGHMNPMVPDF